MAGMAGFPAGNRRSVKMAYVLCNGRRMCIYVGKTPIMKINLLLFPRFILLFVFLWLAGCHHSGKQRAPMDGRVFYEEATMSASAEIAAPEPEPLPSRPPYATHSLVTEE